MVRGFLNWVVIILAFAICFTVLISFLNTVLLSIGKYGEAPDLTLIAFLILFGIPAQLPLSALSAGLMLIWAKVSGRSPSKLDWALIGSFVVLAFAYLSYSADRALYESDLAVLLSSRNTMLVGVNLFDFQFGLFVSAFAGFISGAVCAAQQNKWKRRAIA